MQYPKGTPVIKSRDYKTFIPKDVEVLIDPYHENPVVALKVDPRKDRSFLVPMDYDKAYAVAHEMLRTLFHVAPELFVKSGATLLGSATNSAHLSPLNGVLTVVWGFAHRRGFVVLSKSEYDRLTEFMDDRHPNTVTPAKARMQVYKLDKAA